MSDYEDINGDDESSNIRCAYCGEYIGHSNDAAGHYDSRNDGEVILHRNDYCNTNWDKENPETTMSLYVWRYPPCISCGKPVADGESYVMMPEGHLHSDSLYSCLTEYQEAKDLQDATGGAA